jgi:hypothetical protein
MPKTPLPYSAGYRMVSGEDQIPETLDDAQLAALRSQALPAPAPTEVTEVTPEATSNIPPLPRRVVVPGAGTVAYGSVAEAIKHLPSSDAPQTAAAEVRLRSAFVAACPIVPLAVIR